METERLKRARDVELCPEARLLRSSVIKQSLATGSPANIDALTLLADVGFHSRSIQPVGPFPGPQEWSAAMVADLLWRGGASWCQRHLAELPSRFAESLCTYLLALSALELLSSSSDSLENLLEAVFEFGGVDRAGRSRSVRCHPSQAGTRRSNVVPLHRRRRAPLLDRSAR